MADTEEDTMQRKHLLNQAEIYCLPKPPVPRPAPGAFGLCPPALFQGMSAVQWLAMQWLYARALEEAQAVAAASLPERDLLAVWN